MSRIGRMPIAVPAGVNVTIEGSTVTVKGPKGTLTDTFNPEITVELDGSEIKVSRPNDTNRMRALHGLTRTLVANMVHGVNEGFKKDLEIVGVGYRAVKQGSDLVLSVGFSHQVTMTPPEGVTVEVPSPNQISVLGSSKQAVGQFAAEVRGVRPPEPYKGKGIKYANEVIRRKEGKAGKGGK